MDSREWTRQEILNWAVSQPTVRDYTQVLDKIRGSEHDLEVVQYGRLSHEPERYPLYYLRSSDFAEDKKSILIAAGVHGYEPSGIWAALEWATTRNSAVANEFNVVIFPCISPWGYEKDHRWDIHAEDPNRGFRRDNPRREVEECVAVMDALASLGITFDVAVDLHETPNRDRELRRLRAERFGTPLVDNPDHIPNGFYLVVDPVFNTDSGREFSRSILQAVATETKVTDDPEVMNLPNHNGIVYMQIPGLLMSYAKESGLAQYCATSEVYPDPLPPGEAVAGQIAVIEGALQFSLIR